MRSGGGRLNDDRERCWAEFLAAAESSAAGDHRLARELVARHPIVREELRAFVAAIRAGRLVRTRKGWRTAKSVAEQDRPRARKMVGGAA